MLTFDLYHVTVIALLLIRKGWKMPLIYLQAGACMQMENINKTLFSICFSCFIRNIVIAIFLKYHDTILGYIQIALHV